MFTLGIAASSLIKLEIIFDATGNASYSPEVVGEYTTTPEKRHVSNIVYYGLGGTKYLVSDPFQLNGRETHFVYYRDRAGGLDSHFLILADVEGGSQDEYNGFPQNSGWTTVTVTNNTTSATVTHSRSSATFGTGITLTSTSGTQSAAVWSWANITDTLPTTDNTDSITVVIGK